MFSLAALFALAGSAHAGLRPITNLTIVNPIVSPDGFSRPAVLPCGPQKNGSIDRTIINGTKGDRFMINVINNLDNPSLDLGTSIHWHGIFQRNTTWADGVSDVTQCPITRDNAFLYNFTIDQAGTFWYHSHFKTQYCDGLRGPLIIRDPHDPHANLYDKDGDTDDTVITLSEWYHTVSRQLRNFRLADVYPNSTLINGLGRRPGATEVGTPKGLAVVTVAFGKSYRFRLLHVGCDIGYNFTIDNHTSLTVIEAEGVNYNALEVDKIPIYAGQRYSFVIHANQTPGNYWIRAEPDDDHISGFDSERNMAILHYAEVELKVPTTMQDNSTKPLVETNLIPYDHVPVPGEPYPGGVNKSYNLAINKTDSNDTFTINGTEFKSPPIPVLLQVLSKMVDPKHLRPEGSVYLLPPNSSIELSFPPSGGGNPHPMHLHGHNFHVIRSAGNESYNYINPPIRDVVNVGFPGDNVTVRFVTDNSGPWFLHCHVDWHLVRGLAVVMAEDVDHWEQYNPPPSDWWDLCPAYELTPPETAGSFVMSFLSSLLQFSFASLL